MVVKRGMVSGRRIAICGEEVAGRTVVIVAVFERLLELFGVVVVELLLLVFEGLLKMCTRPQKTRWFSKYHQGIRRQTEIHGSAWDAAMK
jgi:predicted YcjX-like family ATPase